MLGFTERGLLFKSNSGFRQTVTTVILISLVLCTALPEQSPSAEPDSSDANEVNKLKHSKKRPHRYKVRGVKWWILANADQPSNDLKSAMSTVQISKSLQPLTKKQRRLVTKNPGSLQAIIKGAKMAIAECKFQLKARRWNCPTKDSSHGGSIFGKMLHTGSRETAFIYSLTSAAVTHATSRGCSEGSIYTCQCDYRTNKPSGRDWQWGGCSDNAAFGHKYSRSFVDVVERGRDLRYMMNMHNNEAGRLHVAEEMKQECKCHGMSGSCTMKTCWMRLPTWRKVGNMLKDKFDGATRVVGGNAGNTGRSRRPKKFNLIPHDATHKPPTARDIVYFENSPSFCDRSSTFGHAGTKGRECNASSIGTDGCDIMCCGRGHKTESFIVKERCSCIFKWCCTVHCETCTRTKLKHTCL
ncbi:protein Wnt-1-like [Lineus longissimus]|uniref:protein Wnt-1-like n=1 Tax=Lineus longissimus TaxID=88925 RepID=UPI002B4EF5D6